MNVKSGTARTSPTAQRGTVKQQCFLFRRLIRKFARELPPSRPSPSPVISAHPNMNPAAAAAAIVAVD